VHAEPAFYLRPEGAAIELRTPPRLASWNAAGHPDQVRLTASLDFVSIWAAKSVADTSLIRCETATHASLPGPFDYRVTVRTGVADRASSECHEHGSLARPKMII
jgi:hypothetical protein